MHSKQNTNCRQTLIACYVSYIVQAIVNNFVPLLFVTFHHTYGISLSSITMLITFNFIVQLVIDFAAAGFIDKIGYRAALVLAHFLAAAGFICLTILPDALPSPFIGLLISVLLYAAGGGLLEVLVSPVAEALPTGNKEKTMSMLHSFYCWGQVGVVLLSTLFFAVFGTDNWKVMAIFWILIPLGNLLLLRKAPIYTLLEEKTQGMTLPALLKMPLFWLFFLLMLCAGAGEQSVSQWASTFAEQGLSVNKTIGDLAGPMLFALLMGFSRLIYGKYGDKLNLRRTMLYSSILCAGSYLCIALSPFPMLSLIGCGICGFSVGILWPGTYSMASAAMKNGGTLLFALLALAGDLGCSAGPALVGVISDSFQGNLKMGILFAVCFPALTVLGLLILSLKEKEK